MIVVSADGTHFDISRDIADLSDFLRDAHDDEELVMPKVQAREFATILRFCQMHIETPMRNISTPLRTTNLVEYIGEAYTDFVNSIDVHSDLVPLILAADFLAIEPLVSLLCAKIAILAQTSDNVDAFLTQFNPELLHV